MQRRMPQEGEENAFEEYDRMLAEERRLRQYIRPTTAFEQAAHSLASGDLPSAGVAGNAGREVMRSGQSVLAGLLATPVGHGEMDANGVRRMRRPAGY